MNHILSATKIRKGQNTALVFPPERQKCGRCEKRRDRIGVHCGNSGAPEQHVDINLPFLRRNLSKRQLPLASWLVPAPLELALAVPSLWQPVTGHCV